MDGAAVALVPFHLFSVHRLAGIVLSSWPTSLLVLGQRPSLRPFVPIASFFPSGHLREFLFIFRLQQFVRAMHKFFVFAGSLLNFLNLYLCVFRELCTWFEGGPSDRKPPRAPLPRRAPVFQELVDFCSIPASLW